MIIQTGEEMTNEFDLPAGYTIEDAEKEFELVSAAIAKTTAEVEDLCRRNADKCAVQAQLASAILKAKKMKTVEWKLMLTGRWWRLTPIDPNSTAAQELLMFIQDNCGRRLELDHRLYIEIDDGRLSVRSDDRSQLKQFVLDMGITVDVTEVRDKTEKELVDVATELALIKEVSMLNRPEYPDKAAAKPLLMMGGISMATVCEDSSSG